MQVTHFWPILWTFRDFQFLIRYFNAHSHSSQQENHFTYFRGLTWSTFKTYVHSLNYSREDKTVEKSKEACVHFLVLTAHLIRCEIYIIVFRHKAPMSPEPHDFFASFIDTLGFTIQNTILTFGQDCLWKGIDLCCKIPLHSHITCLQNWNTSEYSLSALSSWLTHCFWKAPVQKHSQSGCFRLTAAICLLSNETRGFSPPATETFEVKTDS